MVGMSSVSETVTRTVEIETEHGALVRLAVVERPRDGRVIVIQKVMDSGGYGSLLEPEAGSRVVLPEEVAGQLRDALDAVSEGEL